MTAPRRIAALAVGLAAAACGGDARPRPKIVFEEVPESSGFAFRHELPGGKLDDVVKSAMGGVALIDYDGDGKIDVFCPNGGWDDLFAHGAPRPAKPATCRLYRNLGGMRFTDVTEKAGVAFARPALGACVGDFDGDALPDLFVCAYGMPALYRNVGDGTFEDVAEKAGLVPGTYAGAAFLDYDKDGVLDLFASQYVDLRDSDAPNAQGGFPGPGAFPGRPARLWHGRSDGTFEDVTAKAGLSKLGKGMGVLATDFDGDGKIDVYVANDAMENFLWRNQGNGTFADAAARLNVAYGLEGDPRASMGVTAADLDGDGRLDYLVPDTHGGVVYVAKGNYYTERARDWGFSAAAQGLAGWTDVALDVDNDGRLDVELVHGDLREMFQTQPTALLVNVGPGPRGAIRFSPAGRESPGSSAVEVEITGRGAVAADFDDDGREDLLVIVLGGRARLFRNVTTPVGHWVRLRLVGAGKNTMALGARVTGRAGELQFVREVSGSTGYVSAPDVRLHFGLGAAASLDDVVVRWPDGREQRVGSLEADRDHVVREER